MAHTFSTTALAASPDTSTGIANTVLADLASSPRKIVTDEGSVEERDAKDIIALDNHLAAKAVGDSPLHGLRISRCIPAGPQ
jgi:hypothetical protein